MMTESKEYQQFEGGSKEYQKIEGEEIGSDELKAVFYNVLSIIGILLFSGMLIVGIVFFHDCPTQPYLAIYMIIQGLMSINMPILFLLKYRLHVPLKRVLYLSIVATLAVMSVAWFCTGTYWLITAGCPNKVLYRAAIGFLVPIWLLVAVCVGVFVYACYHKYD